MPYYEGALFDAPIWVRNYGLAKLGADRRAERAIHEREMKKARGKSSSKGKR